MHSLLTAKTWKNILLPHGTQCFRAACPFCAIPLDGDNPFIRLIYQVKQILFKYSEIITQFRTQARSNFNFELFYFIPLNYCLLLLTKIDCINIDKY